MIRGRYLYEKKEADLGRDFVVEVRSFRGLESIPGDVLLRGFFVCVGVELVFDCR